MKKFSRLFLLALCSGFLFLGFSNAQNLPEQSGYINSDFESDPGKYFTYDPNLDYGYNYIPSWTIYIFRFLFVILLISLYKLITLYKGKSKPGKNSNKKIE